MSYREDFSIPVIILMTNTEKLSANARPIVILSISGDHLEDWPVNARVGSKNELITITDQ
jgi:hypothetical protein